MRIAHSTTQNFFQVLAEHEALCQPDDALMGSSLAQLWRLCAAVGYWVGKQVSWLLTSTAGFFMFRATVRHLVHARVYGSLGLLLGGLAVFIWHQLDRPDLRPWHLAPLEAEFTAADAERVADLAGYQALEQTLFAQLQQQVVETLPSQERQQLNRYNPGSWSDPERFEVNWNRSFELSADQPKAVVLMLHGMSDSPYSLRTLGQALHARGNWVVGLRIPGHGTAPAGLTRVRWEDFAALLRLVARDLRARLGDDVPLYLLGYSNGAALAIEYTLAVLEGEDLPRPAGLLLLSPAVEVSPMAALAHVNLLLSELPGLEKLAWLDLQPEFDPFKYNSFPVNAGFQVYRLTSNIADRIDALDQGGGVVGFPPVLAFESVADATVSMPGLIREFMQRLAPGGHELVLFDVNRESKTSALLARDPAAALEPLFGRELRFDLSLVTNRDAGSREVVVRHHPVDGGTERHALDMRWPPELYSLSHVALPFAPDDPVYGVLPSGSHRGMTLGTLEPRGERSLLQVPIGQLMRLRYNPFFAYVERRIGEAVNRVAEP